MGAQRSSWTWRHLGPNQSSGDPPADSTTLHAGEVVYLDDGSVGVVADVNPRPRVPRILVTQRTLGTYHMDDRWYIPANIVG